MQRRLERSWTSHGMKCAVFLLNPFCHRCGYVTPSPDSPLVGLGWNSPELDGIDVHGGITFADVHDSITSGGKPQFAFGFDCAHYADAPDVEAARKVWGDAVHPMVAVEPFWHAHVWTLDEVVAETESLCGQLAEVERSMRGAF